MLPYLYQLIVIGSGPGGTAAAIRSAQLGLRVALVEKDQLGGVCLNRGCIPSKTLLYSAQLFERMNDAKTYGLQCEKLSYDYAKVLDRSRRVVDRLSKGVEFLFKKNKIDIFRGQAHVTGPHSILIEPEKRLEADRILLAAGTGVKEISGFKIDGQSIISSDQALSQNRVPRSVFILGGGVLGVEFAYFYRALGAEVTLLEAQDRLLPGLEAELGQELERSFRKKGIKVLCGCRASKAQIENAVVRITYEDKVRVQKEIFAEQVLVGVGRKALSDGLGLESLGIEIKDGFIKVAKNYQTSVPSVFAIGDVIGPPLLAHAASEEGKIAVEMIVGKRSEGLEKRDVPNCVYSHPEAASVGLSEEEAISEGFIIKVGKFPFRASGRALAEGHEEGFVKVIVDAKSGKLLGGHILGEGATELIAELTLIRALGISVEDVAKVIHAHPTLSEAVYEALMVALGRSLNF